MGRMLDFFGDAEDLAEGIEWENVRVFARFGKTRVAKVDVNYVSRRIRAGEHRTVGISRSRLEYAATSRCSRSAFCPVSSAPFDPDRWFHEEVLPHEPALRAWLRARYPMLHDIDDLVQESYSRVLRARSLAPIGSVKSFLFATARNLAFDHFRRKKISGTESLAEMDELSVSEDGPGVFETVSRQQELELLTQAIQSLPERCRQVLTLRKIYGLSQKQIAAELGITEHTVEAQVSNGVRRCAEFLARHGLP